MSLLQSTISSLSEHLPFAGLLPEAGLQATEQSSLTAPLCIPAVSCSIKSVPELDGCCINEPSGHFLQTQFWDPSPALGSPTSWTVHGLWPDYCEGGFDQFCDDTRRRTPEEITHILTNASIAQEAGGTHPGLLDFMSRHWLSLNGYNPHLWAHEWNKHGTCISTMEPKCYARDRVSGHEHEYLPDNDVLDYFTHAALLFNSLATYDFFERHGIVPSKDRKYELEHLKQAILDSPHGHDAVIRCRNHNELAEIWYSFHVRASLRSAMDLWWDGNRQWNTWVPTDPTGEISNCPATGIKYLPKNGARYPPAPTHTRSRTVPTATPTIGPSSRPFVGKGRLMVKVISDESLTTEPGLQSDRSTIEPLPSQYTGCLIRKGTWYMSNSLTSCAIFTAQDDARTPSKVDEDEDYHLFTIASRFAPCSFVEGPLSPHELTGDEVDVDLAGSLYFSCAQELPFQSILSNDASIRHQHTEAAKRMTFGSSHRSTFYADKIPTKAKQLQLWTNDGWGSRKVKVEVYWEGL